MPRIFPLAIFRNRDGLYQGTTLVRIVHLTQGVIIWSMKLASGRFPNILRDPVGIRLLLAAGLAAIITLCHKRLAGDLRESVTFVLLWTRSGHPILAQVIRVARDITPDVSILLLALAGLGYLMPDAVKKIEESKPLRIVLATVFLVFATLTIVLNEVDRIDKRGATARIFWHIEDYSVSGRRNSPRCNSKQGRAGSGAPKAHFSITTQ